MLTWCKFRTEIPTGKYSKIHGPSGPPSPNLTVDATHDGAVFVCKMSSPGFSDRVRSCTYGPLTVVTSGSDKSLKFSTQESINIKDPNQNEGSFKAEKCNTSCQPDDLFTILYWAIACVGTTILLFVFLTTTIIYCCKYQTNTGEIVATEKSLISCDGSEPVYVSLQRREPS